MISIAELIGLTNTFFDKHWGSPEPIPKWNNEWKWVGPVPNYKLGGLYAIFSDGALIYIGLGASRGKGNHKDRGISRRLVSHVLKIAPKEATVSYVPRERWAKVGADQIATIGFPKELNYLAAALEDFLIGELNPAENKAKLKNS